MRGVGVGLGRSGLNWSGDGPSPSSMTPGPDDGPGDDDVDQGPAGPASSPFSQFSSRPAKVIEPGMVVKNMVDPMVRRFEPPEKYRSPNAVEDVHDDVDASSRGWTIMFLDRILCTPIVVGRRLRHGEKTRDGRVT